jgi:hypothetical protein
MAVSGQRLLPAQKRREIGPGTMPADDLLDADGHEGPQFRRGWFSLMLPKSIG